MKNSVIDLRPWAPGDLALLERIMGDPAMTTYLGGPEPLENIRKRHERYLQMDGSGKGRIFVIVAGPERAAAESVGYWNSESDGQAVWEIGWSVLPEYQGRGIATKATIEAVEQARSENKHRFIHAFPSVENGASNTICRKAGFTLEGEVEFPYWRDPDKFITCNNWRLDLFAEPDVS